jgi:hypothetical protein
MPNSLLIVKRFFPKVESVTQAKRKVLIEVTADDSAIGRGKAHHACAMARACKRALKLDGAIVSMGTAYLVKGTHATRYAVPHVVSREIVSFDRGSGFAPGLYTLNRPQAKRAPTRARGTGHGAGPRTGKPKHVTANVRTALSA